MRRISQHKSHIEEPSNIVRVGIDETLPPLDALLYGLQHVLTMFAGLIAVPLLVGSAIGLSPAQLAIIVQGSLLFSGIGSLVQSLGIGWVGARLPVVMGTAFVFITPMISIGNSLGIQAIFGAAIVGGLAELLLSLGIVRIRHFFPPLVTGTVVTLVGLSLIPVGFGWAAGGEGPLFGQQVSFIISGVVLLTILLINRFSRGFLSSIAVVLAIVVGYALASALGILDLSPVAQAEWVSAPQLFAFGPPQFFLSAILVILVAQFASVLETLGDVFATGVVARRETKARELRGAISVDGLISALSPLLNGLPITSFSQNVGVIGITGMASRFAVAAGGGILVVMAFFPKLSSLIAAMPDPVLGGAGLVMFGAVAAAGIQQIGSIENITQRDLLIVAVSLGLGLGFGLHPPGALDQLPKGLTVFLESGIVVGGFTAVILERLFPKRKST